MTCKFKMNLSYGRLSAFLNPLLAIIFPILFFYSYNQTELSYRIILTPLVLSFLLGICVFSFFLLVFRNTSKTGTITTAVLIQFFSYGHISNFLTSYLFPKLPNEIIIDPNKLLIPLCIMAILILFYKIRRSKNNLLHLDKLIGIILLILTGFSLIEIISYEFRSSRQTKYINSDVGDSSSISQANISEQPDIYYIILDGYAREDILKEVYSYDNSLFINFLKSNKFFVASKSTSNYAHTYLSLASSLNMSYLDFLSENSSKATTDPYKMIKKSEVVSNLKENGYTIINFSSGWESTDKDFQSDIYINYSEIFSLFGKEISTNEFNLTFLKTTMLSPFIKEYLANALRNKFLYTFQKLTEIPYIKGKKFVMVHILIPHPPYIFETDGSPVVSPNLDMIGKVFEDKEGYLKQLIFATQKVSYSITKILENSPNPPIIILQSDHGPASLLGHPAKWKYPDDNEALKERLSILNAYYIPEKYHLNLYDSISPVNTFRIIFNQIFNMQYQILPDKNYYSDSRLIFSDVTKRINSPSN